MVESYGASKRSENVPPVEEAVLPLIAHTFVSVSALNAFVDIIFSVCKSTACW